MKTTIKIHDSEWFKKHCKVVGVTEYGHSIAPKYLPWNHVYTLSWSLNSPMGQLIGQVLEVGRDDGINSGSIDDVRYFAKSFWIPNWAIEWVKEEQE